MSKVVRKEQCPICQDSGKDNLIIYDNDSSYCFACSYSEQGGLPHTKENIFEPKAMLISEENLSDIALAKRGITTDTCKKYNVQLTRRGQSEIPTLVFPYYRNNKLVAQKLKTPDKGYSILGDITISDFFGSQNLNSPGKKLVITEGEEDCLAVSQILGGPIHVTSLTNGAQSVDKFVEKYYKKLLEYEQLIVCFDQDEVGQEASLKFLKHFPVGKVGIARFQEKDACDMLKSGLSEDLKWSILRPDMYKPDGVLKVGELTQEYFDEPFEKGIELPFPQLNLWLGGMRKGELTMVTSGTGMGKSTWCTNLIYDFLLNKGKTIVDIKLEETQRKSIYTYLAMHTNMVPRTLRENPDKISEEQRMDFINKFQNLYIHNHFGSMDSKELLNVLDYYATIVKADFIFLDHISIAVSGLESSRDGERKDIDKLLTKIRELIDRTGVGFICVSHLKNPPAEQLQWEAGRSVRRSDLRGSGSLGQLSDNIIAIEGDLVEEESKLLRQLKLIKTRYGDAQEMECDYFHYDIYSGRITVVNE